MLLLFDILIISFLFTFKDFLPASGGAGLDGTLLQFVQFLD
jgi:hypothetical protein